MQHRVLVRLWGYCGVLISLAALHGCARTSAPALPDELAAALAAGDVQRVKGQLDRDPALANARSRGSPALHEAIRGGAQVPRTAIVALLLDRGADVNARGHMDATALSMAVDRSDTETTALLLNRGADINDTRAPHGTPLHHVCQVAGTGLAVVNLLLDRKADATLEDRYGLTALDRVEFLIKLGGKHRAPFLDGLRDVLLRHGAVHGSRSSRFGP